MSHDRSTPLSHRLRFLASLGKGLASLALSLCLGCSSSSVLLLEQQFGWSVERRPIAGWIVTAERPPFGPVGGEIDSDTEPENETVLLFAAIHGDEPLSVPLIERFLEEVRERPDLVEGKRLVVLPVANPDGLKRKTRGNANRVDLNRNFPSANWRRRKRHGPRPASEPETQVLVDIVERFDPVRILSVHAPLHCVNYDGPAAEIAAAMASVSNYPVKSSIGYATPGSFGSWAGAERGIPVITLELRKNLREEEVWEELGEAVMAFVGWRR